MIKQKTAERREFIRAKRILSIQHRLYQRKGKHAVDVWRTSATQDMSWSGLLFASEVAYLMGDTLELQVVLMGALDVFKCFGKVVRCDRKKTGVVYTVAVQLISQPRKPQRS